MLLRDGCCYSLPLIAVQPRNSAFQFTSKLNPRYPSLSSPTSRPKSRSCATARPLAPCGSTHYPPLTAHFPLVTPHLLHVASISLPFSAASVYFLSPQGCTPRQTYGSSETPTLLLPITSLQPQQFHAITHSFAQRRAAIPPILNSFHTLSVATGVVPLLPPCSGLRSSVLRFFPQLLALCFQQLAASFFLFALFLPTQLFVFNRLQTLFQKHRGWGWAHNPAIWNQQHPDSFFPRLVLLGALRASVANPLRFRISPQPAWWRRVR